jgi:hypothetical protein
LEVEASMDWLPEHEAPNQVTTKLGIRPNRLFVHSTAACRAAEVAGVAAPP